ncbi:hypothetical protein M0R45_020206 [Rubus argutus]|uniref:Uncharacterized protein n=1 Tax=Rubus argutus TaxID=59490 RepID=A0AAW1X884_RUBAR
MEVTQVLHMNKGDGETSYAKNSTIQRKALSIAKPIIEEAVQELIMSSNVMGIESMGKQIWVAHLDPTPYYSSRRSWMSYTELSRRQSQNSECI